MKTPHRFGSFSISEGSLSFGKCAAGLGFRLLGKKHLLILFVLLTTQLCEEWRAAGGGRRWGQPCSQHGASPATSCQPSQGAVPALPPSRPPHLSAPTLFFSDMHYLSKHQLLEWVVGWLYISSAVGFGVGGWGHVNIHAC